DADALGHIAPIQRAGVLSLSVFDEVFGLGFCLWHEIGRLSRGRCRAEDECQGGQCGGAEGTGRGEAGPEGTGASARGRVCGCARRRMSCSVVDLCEEVVDLCEEFVGLGVESALTAVVSRTALTGMSSSRSPVVQCPCGDGHHRAYSIVELIGN